nr:MAG TPA: hypothetical protein [Bacteriophage sp.]
MALTNIIYNSLIWSSTEEVPTTEWNMNATIYLVREFFSERLKKFRQLQREL